jgi:hypothetical protein
VSVANALVKSRAVHFLVGMVSWFGTAGAPNTLPVLELTMWSWLQAKQWVRKHAPNAT